MIEGSPGNSAREQFMVQTRHILIVDDDAELRGALAEQLALHEEFAVSVAENATSARTIAHDNPPDLIVMDVGLRIREDGRCRRSG